MIIRFDDPVQQEIWAAIRALNDAWTKGNPDDLANYFHRNMLAITSTDRLAAKVARIALPVGKVSPMRRISTTGKRASQSFMCIAMPRWLPIISTWRSI